MRFFSLFITCVKFRIKKFCVSWNSISLSFGCRDVDYKTPHSLFAYDNLSGFLARCRILRDFFRFAFYLSLVSTVLIYSSSWTATNCAGMYHERESNAENEMISRYLHAQCVRSNVHVSTPQMDLRSQESCFIVQHVLSWSGERTVTSAATITKMM